MKNKLNLKGQFNNSQTAVNPDCQPTVNRRSRLMSVLCLLTLLTLGTGQMWADYTWYSGDLLYYDFTAVTTGGVNWHNGSSMQYDASGHGQVKKVEFSSSVTMKNDWVIAKTEKGSWAEIKFSNPSSVNQRRFIISADGKSGSWGYLDKYIAGDNWGDIGDWSTTTKKMTNNNDGTYTVTINSVTASAHKFKIVNYDTWTGAIGYSSNVSCENGTVKDDGNGNIQFTPYIAGDVTISYNGTNVVITCTAPTVTFDKEGGSGGTDSQSTPYGTATSNISAPSKTGYNFGGYYDGDDGTGNQVINASGVWQKDKTNFTNNDATCKWVVTSNRTLYAKWTEKTYSLTFSCTNGSIAVGGANVSSGSTANVNHFTTKTLVATPNSGYRFTGWTLSGSNTSAVTIADASAASTTIKATATGATVTANFEALPNGQLDIVAGSNGQVKKQGGSWGSSASYTGINDNSDLNIYAQANSGYHFVNWTKSGDGSIKTNAATGVYTLPGRGSATVTANFAETTYTVNVALSDASQSGGTTSPNGNTSVGAITPVAITAPMPATGYLSSGHWTTTGGVTVADPTANSTTITATSAGTVRWTFDENLTSDCVLKGGFDSWKDGVAMTKHTGESTGTVVYCTRDFTASSDPTQIKIIEGSTWYGANNSTNSLVKITGSSFSMIWNLTNQGEGQGAGGGGYNINFYPSVTGTYTFKYDYSSHQLQVYYPVLYQLQVFSADPTDATNTNNFDWDSHVGNVYTKTLSLNANTTYEFKCVVYSDFYGNNGKMEYGSSSDWDMSLGVNNCRIATTVAGDYEFAFTYTGSGGGDTKRLTVTYPTVYTVTYNKGTGGNTISASATSAGGTFTSGAYVRAGDDVTFTQTALTGYTFAGWYDAETGGSAIPTMGESDNVLNGISANKTVWSRYSANEYTITLDVDEANKGNITSATTSQTIHYNEATTTVPNLPTAADGYGLDGYYTGQNGAGTKLINGDGTWINDVAGYTSADGKWIHTSAVTLYAHYKQAEITSFTGLSGAYQPGATEEGVTANIYPSPAGTTIVCWRVLYAENDDPIASQPTFTEAGANTVSFVMPEISGNYKLEATLRLGGSCESGDVLSTYTQQFNVAGSHNVTIQYKCGDVVIKESTVQSVAAFEATSITAPDIVGYTFSSWTLGEGVSIAGGTLTSSPISVTAIYTSTITANYTPKRMIYFKNTLGWSGVTVYFYKNDSYWNDSKGTGADHTYSFTNTPFSEQKYGVMTQIPGTDIYYFDAEGAGVNASYTNVAFTEADQHGYGYFYDTKVTRRGDYKSSMPMFVPLAQTPVSMNDGRAKYYNQGYWMNYPENTGYKLRIYPAWNSNNASGASREYYFPYSADLQMPLKLDVELNTTEKVWFMVYRNDNVLMGKEYSVTQDNHETKLDKPSDQKLELNPSAPGVYSFTLTFHDDEGSPKNYDYYINVDYPVSLGDYRIYYTDNATWSQGSAHAAGWYHTSDAIRKNTGSEEKSDTVSLFVSYGSSPSAKFQYVSAIEGSTVTWTDVAGGTIDLSGITKKGVYNFIVSQPAGGASISLSKTEKYTGNYYIRTDCAGNTKWDNFRTRDHQMTYTEFSMSDANSFGDKFSHYFAHWCPAGTNVKFCVANDYSVCISDTLTQDVGDPFSNIDIYGNLKSDNNPDATANIYSANIRFMYNETTNKISRAYVSAASNKSRQFLVLKGNNTLLNEDESALSGEGESAANHEAIFVDNENFIYERILKIIPGTRFKLYACYAKNPIDVTKAQYFRGKYDDGNFTSDENSVVLLSGSGDAQKLRVIYDFKTNRLVAAWMPSTTDVSGVLKIDADVMVLRDHQEAAECITFANGESKLDGVKTVYGAMKFNRWTLNNRYRGEGGVEDNNKDHCDTPEDITRYHGILPSGSQKSIYERSLYFISFPFNVKVSEIFGFGHYWDEWYLEYYDGETRAKNGYWLDSPPNWKYVTPEMAEDYVLEAYKGYILGLDLDYMGYDNTTFWANNISNVELYFPSQTTMSSIKQTEVTIPALGEEYRCTINRGTPEGDRRIKDSFWRCIGVPSYNEFAGELKSGNSSGSTIAWQTNENQFPFLYAWNMTDNSLTAQSTSTFSFKPMHAYLVQIQDAIYWNMVSATPASIVARRVAKEAEIEYNWRLEISKDSTFVDQTYVRMSNIEQVTDTFDFGQDLVKELNATRSNIYTFVGYERLAANSMPLETEQTTIVPLGLNIKTAGDYTFAMPDGTNGVGVTLVDTEANVRTSLSALDYTVSLEAGEYTGRFVLEISPIQNTPTDLGNVQGDNVQGTKARKVMIDGILYIVKDGKMYDARGARVE